MKNNLKNTDIKHVIKKIVYDFYKKVEFSIIAVNIINYLYNRILPYFKKTTRPFKYRGETVHVKINDYSYNRDINSIKIAFICDEMTYRCFNNECETVFLTPNNWFQTITNFQPDILLCESAWSGINKFENCWRGRIYKNNNLKFENRRELFQILNYCKKANIKTVFWNKEDPVFFNNKVYNFTDTALHFDYIFTTSKECVDKYKLLGHKNVNTLMFGFSPRIYNPIGSRIKENVAIFAGSWYADQIKRCKDMDEILELIKNEDIKFEIYNRYYKSANPINKFPIKYEPYLKEGIDFTKLSSVIKKARYAVNINTVTDSETMFARRVFELMACNTIIISNYSKGMEQLFGQNIWFINKKFDNNLIEDKLKENLDIVFQNHTYNQRLKEILTVTKIPFYDSQKQFKIIYQEDDIKECSNHFKSLNIPDKEGYILKDGILCSLDNEDKIDVESLCVDNQLGYFIIIKLDTINDFNIEKAMCHFSYIDDDTGIKNGKTIYEFIRDKENINTLFNANMMKSVLENINMEIKKYII